MYVGTSNNNPQKGIELCYFDTISGSLSVTKVCANILNPSYLDVDSNFLYSVGKLKMDSDQFTPVVVCYSVDPASGELNVVSIDSTYGKDPCYVAYDSTTENLYVANYSSGNVSAYSVQQGKIDYKNSVQHSGFGPNVDRQEGPHAHSINVDPQSKYIYSCDLGIDKLLVYELVDEGLQLVDSIVCHPGAGPRHFDFSPDGNLMAVLNELDCTVTLFQKDLKGIYKEELKTLRLLPDTFQGFAKAADIHFSRDGKFLYASNRGFNSINIFKVAGSQIEFVGREMQGINWPRNFVIDPSGKFLLVANRKANSITVYRRNVKDGLLQKLPNSVTVEEPVCLKFFYEH